MGVNKKGFRMEGWLYLIRTNRLGLQYSRKHYFILEGNSLDCYKSRPRSSKENPVRGMTIDSSIQVAENGRGRITKTTLSMFTLYSAFNHHDQLKLGAESSEEIAVWIQYIKEAALKDTQNKGENGTTCYERRMQSSRFSHTKNKSRIHSTGWKAYWSATNDMVASDVTASSPWTIFGCKDGLRLFKEVKNGNFPEKSWDSHPAVMAIGIVDANSEDIFHTLMSLGPSRSEWDFCLSRGSIVERLNENTDIIHKCLNSDWLPRGMSKRDLLLQRHWRREDDGTYAIVYNSVFRPSCRPEKGYIRASLKRGGYIISPVNHGKQSVVKHMLAIDWKSWRSYLFASSAEYITIRMLGRIAALREFFRTEHGDGSCSNYSSGELIREVELPQSVKEHIKLKMHKGCGIDYKSNEESTDESRYSSPKNWGMAESGPELNDVAEEFFDVSVGQELDKSEDAKWTSDENKESKDIPELPKGSILTNLLQVIPGSYGTTLPRDPSGSIECSWTNADPSTFLIRGASFFQDHQKVKASSTFMELVGVDWLKSDKREDDLGGRPGGIIQKHALQGSSKFFFIVNMQVPGSTSYFLALYYAMDLPLENVPLLKKFVNGNDAYRNSRFKLIPFISKGSWIVKQSVGKKSCLVGQSLKINYFKGRNYFEMDIDVASSAIARSVNGLVLKYLTNLVIEMAFVIQGNTEKELPEMLLGTCRLAHLDVSKAVTAEPLLN